MELLLERVHSGVQRIQQNAHVQRLQKNVHAHLQNLAMTGAAPQLSTSTWALESMFVPQHWDTTRHRTTSSATPTPRFSDCEGQTDVLTDMDGVSLLIASYLDGESVAAVQGVSRAWRAFIAQYREVLYAQLLHPRACGFPNVISSSCAFKSYLFSLRDALDIELRHTIAIEPVATALEQYCVSDSSGSAFVAMFCDLIEFQDPTIAKFVAHKRQSALSMVLVRTPDDVRAFRKRSHFVGPITFVPIENPHWPPFEPYQPLADCPGFLGYAYDHATIVPGYESLQQTVVKSILKELMLFDTQDHATAYGLSIGTAPFAAIVSDDPEDGADYNRWAATATFSTPLRRRMRHLTAQQRIDRLKERIVDVDRCIMSHVN